MSKHSKLYTLELTAEELNNFECLAGKGAPGVYQKLHNLAQQAVRDAAADDLRLPWRATTEYGNRGWCIERNTDCGGYALACGADGERVAKLMSAAPELLEACKLVPVLVHATRTETKASRLEVLCVEVENLAYRALRKIETGVPE